MATKQNTNQILTMIQNLPADEQSNLINAMRMLEVNAQDEQYFTNVTKAMQAAGWNPVKRATAGVKAALRNKMEATKGINSGKVARGMRLFGMRKTADFIDRWFTGPSKKKLKKVTVPSGGTSTTGGSGGGSITAFKKQLDYITVTVDRISEDVTDIKSLLMPKGVVAKSKSGEEQFVQFNPLAPPGEQFNRITESGKLTPIKPGKEFQQSAQKKAAYATAELVLKIIEKDRARVELKKKYQFKEEAEKYNEKDDADAEFREQVEKNFDEIDAKLEGKDKSGIFSWLLKLLPFAGFLTTLGKMGLVGIAAWVGTKIGDYIWDKIGVPVLDAVFKIKEWWDNLDILGTLKDWIDPITNAIKKVTDFLHITKSDEEYAAEAAANAAAGRMPGGVASGGNLKSLAENIAALEKQRDAEKDPAKKVQIQGAIDSLKKHLPKSSGPQARRGPRGQTIPAEIMAEGSDTVDTNYANVPVAPVPTPPPAPSKPAPSKPAVGGTGTLTTASKDIPPEGRAFLDALSIPESGGDYTSVVGSGKFGGPAKVTNFADHPRAAGVGIDANGKWVPVNSPKKVQVSTAAGKYQITKTTWDELRRKHSDLKDFSPANQDKAAWYLARDRYKANTGRDLLTDLRERNFAKITSALNATWTSLAGGSEAQRRGGVSETQARYDDFLARQSVTPSQTIPGAQMDGQSRAHQASITGTGSGVTLVNAPVVNNTKVSNTVGKRPAQKADVLAQDKSLVRTVSKDVQHPAYG